MVEANWPRAPRYSTVAVALAPSHNLLTVDNPPGEPRRIFEVSSSLSVMGSPVRSAGPFTHHAPVSGPVQREPGPLDECLVGSDDETTACVCVCVYVGWVGGGGVVV